MHIQNKKNNHEQSAKRNLLQAGIALFAEKGYASTSVREIVEKAGVTKPVLYYYFQSKEGMFHAILNWAAERLEIMLSEVLETPGSVFDRLIHLYRHLYDGILENPNLFKMIHNLIFGPPQGTPQYDFDQYPKSMIKIIKAIYLEGLARDEVTRADPDEVALLVLGLIDFCFHLDDAHPESLDPERPERLLRLAFQGLENSNT
jgi:AcrR family transcriptional regulator